MQQEERGAPPPRGAGASIPYLRSLGVDRIEAHRRPLLDRLREEMTGLGLECVTPPGTTSPILTFAVPDGDPIRRRFERAGIDARVASTFVRFSPSVYNDMSDIDRVLEALS